MSTTTVVQVKDRLDRHTGPQCTHSGCTRAAGRIPADSRCVDHAPYGDAAPLLRPIPEHLQSLLVNGTGADRSGAARSWLLSARQSGCALSWAKAQLTSPRNQLSELFLKEKDSKSPTGFRTISEHRGEQRLQRLLDSTDEWIIAHPVTTAPDEQLMMIGEIEMIARSVQWTGQGASVDLKVLLVLLAQQRERGGWTSFEMPSRTLAMLCGMAQKSASRCLLRLMADGWLSRDEKLRYTLRTPNTKKLKKMVSIESGTTSYDVAEMTAVVYDRSGLGPSAGRLRGLLLAHPDGLSRRQLIEMGMSRDTLKRQLQKLLVAGAVAPIITADTGEDDPYLAAGLDGVWIATGNVARMAAEVDLQRQIAGRSTPDEVRARRRGLIECERRESRKAQAEWHTKQAAELDAKITSGVHREGLLRNKSWTLTDNCTIVTADGEQLSIEQVLSYSAQWFRGDHQVAKLVRQRS